MNNEADYIQPFIFNDCNVRGELVCLNQVIYQAVILKNYPPNIARWLVELLVANSLLCSLLKNVGDGLSLQIKAVNFMLQTQCMHGGNLRAKANYQTANLKSYNLANSILMAVFKSSLGTSYQSFIVLEQADVAQGLMQYFADSHQLETYIKINFVPHQENKAYGLLLQKMPNGSDNFAQIVSQTKKLKLNQVNFHHLNQLFTNKLTSFSKIPITAKCDCTASKLLQLLANLDKKELKQVLIENNNLISLNCEWCLTQYQFNSHDLGFS